MRLGHEKACQKYRTNTMHFDELWVVCALDREEIIRLIFGEALDTVGG